MATANGARALGGWMGQASAWGHKELGHWPGCTISMGQAAYSRAQAVGRVSAHRPANLFSFFRIVLIIQTTQVLFQNSYKFEFKSKNMK
jgi:hypothetical protein